jgi:hypothetical protein
MTATRKRATKKAADAAPGAAPKAASMVSITAAPKSTERPPAVATLSQRPAAPVPAPSSAASTARTASVANGSRPDPVIAKVVDADERRRMIAEAAYHKFLQRGPGNGTPAQDWTEAEAEIDALLAEQQIVRAQ